MRELTERPLFFERNRVWRVYEGGMLFHDLIGDPKEDNHMPEEWVASTVKAINEKSSGPLEGLSIIKDTDVTLKELIEKYPGETVGNRGTLEVLVKYLDSAIRLPMQVHPDREYSEKYFNSSYGKTEMWLILATRENASICFGFKDKISKEEFSDIIEKSKTDKNIMDQYLNRVPVKPGDVYLIPGKAVHAIGAGCLILEVQEPTDFTIQPEYWCGDHMLSNQEMYIGLSKDVALDCFDYSLYGTDSIKGSKKEPKLLEKNESYQKEALITKEDTPCFLVNRYYIYSSLRLEEAPSIYIAVNGTGVIEGEGYRQEIRKGDYFFLSKNAAFNFTALADDGQELELVSCMPPEHEEHDRT